MLPSTWQIPAGIRNRLGREAGPQRAMIDDGHLLLVLHEPPDASATQRVPAFFWRLPSGHWKIHRADAGPSALAGFLDAYEQRLLQQEALTSGSPNAATCHAVLEAVAPLLRAARGLHRALQEARQGVRHDPDLINHRDRAAAIERTAELLLQDAQFGLSYIAARQSESHAESAARMAATAHRLNILAALFLPLTAVASVLGMDIHSGIADNTGNFWLIVAAGTSLGLLVALAVRRNRQ